MGTPFLMTPEVDAQIRDLAQRASRNTVPFETIQEQRRAYRRGQGTAALLNEYLTLQLPFGHLMTYTVEEFARGILCHHLSVSSPNIDRIPTPVAVQMLADVIGFKEPVIESLISTQDIENGGKAIDVVQPIHADRETFHKALQDLSAEIECEINGR